MKYIFRLYLFLSIFILKAPTDIWSFLGRSTEQFKQGWNTLIYLVLVTKRASEAIVEKNCTCQQET